MNMVSVMDVKAITVFVRPPANLLKDKTLNITDIFK